MAEIVDSQVVGKLVGELGKGWGEEVVRAAFRVLAGVLDGN